MEILWYIVLGLVCYIGIVTLIDFLVSKFRTPKKDYFSDLKKGGEKFDDKKKI